jgi:adenylate cyclase
VVVMSGELPATARSSEELSGAELAARAGVGIEEIQRLVNHGVLVPREGRGAPFRAVDVMKIRVARACEEGGLPMEGIAKAIRAGHLSFAFIESWPFEPWAARGPRTHAELATEVGLPFESLQRIVEAFGFARPEPGDAIVAAERPVAALIGRAMKVGLVDEAASVRFGNLYAEALRRIAAVETEVYHSGIEMPLLRSGLGERRTMELAEEVTEEVTELLEGALIAVYRRQQELTWTEHQIEHIEQALEAAGVRLPPGQPPAMCFLDLAGYTRLTEERGDEEAAALAARLADIVRHRPRQHRGEAVKWLGDGVMFHFRDPSGAVVSALEMVEDVPAAGLPPAHVGVAAGPVIRQGGDYFGRTVNLASRIADHARGGQVLVSEPVVAMTSVAGVRFDGLGAIELPGLTSPIRLFEARRS